MGRALFPPTTPLATRVGCLALMLPLRPSPPPMAGRMTCQEVACQLGWVWHCRKFSIHWCFGHLEHSVG
eukprot:7667562-Alexandrium_andersonii.AAC.1